MPSVSKIFKNRSELEVMYTQSWAVGAFINIPIDDQFIRGRQFITEEEGDDGKRTTMEAAEKEFEVTDRLSRALKMGRLYGTGLLVIVDHGELDTPFDVERMREGDLISFMPLDRFDAHVPANGYDVNKHSPTYGQPLRYNVSPAFAPPLRAGHQPGAEVRWPQASCPLWGTRCSEREWGVSCLGPDPVRGVPGQACEPWCGASRGQGLDPGRQARWPEGGHDGGRRSRRAHARGDG